MTPEEEALVHVAEALIRLEWDGRTPLGKAVNDLSNEIAMDLLARYSHDKLPKYCGLTKDALAQARKAKKKTEQPPKNG